MTLEYTSEKQRKVFLVGTGSRDEGQERIREYLDELAELVKTLGAETVGSMTVVLREINPRFHIGSGKADELREAASAAGADAIIFDTPLGPSQQRNLEKLCGMKVIDRQEVILDIFAKRAGTKEAVLQVELARFKYFLPRLTGAWTHLSRQHGGGTLARGEGEKQIELDKRELRMKIAELESELEYVRSRRGVQRKNRIRNKVPSGAIVGYTNAGKSTLLNTLTGSDVMAEDKLFATLDPTTRRMILPDKTELVLTDTVGFIRKLPHSLVEAFKSTLEEAVLADFIVLVFDISNPQVCSHWETVLSVLDELGAGGKPMLTVFNKIDLAPDPLALVKMRSLVSDAVFVSCAERRGLDELVERLAMMAASDGATLELAIPPGRADVISMLHAKCRIFESSYADDGMFIAHALVPESLKRQFEPFVCA